MQASTCIIQFNELLTGFSANTFDHRPQRKNISVRMRKKTRRWCKRLLPRSGVKVDRSKFEEMNREITFCLKSKRLKCAPLYMLSKSSINHKRALSVSRPVAMVITSHHCCSARSPMVALLTGSHRLQGVRQPATGQTDNLLPFLQIRFTSQ